MKTYRVEFAIDVTAETANEACRRAWELMTRPDSMLPIGTVHEVANGERQDIDLQALAETQADCR
jgi:hypothetical protein